jgi:hypothetical protein
MVVSKGEPIGETFKARLLHYLATEDDEEVKIYSCNLVYL